MTNVNDRVSVTPQYIIEGAGKITVDGRDIGSFNGGLRATWATTEAFVDSDYAIGHVKMATLMTTLRLETELEEATMENLAMAWGIPTSSVSSCTSSKTLALKPPGHAIEHVVVFEGMSAEDNTKKRIYTVNNAVRVGSTQMTLKRGTRQGLPIAFECLIGSDDTFGSILEEILTA
jgi:hypothetical protein